MRMTTLSLRGVMALCVILLAACGGMRRGGADSIEVTVNNDLLPATAVTVWMIPETGARRQLGTVSPLRTQTFAFSPTGVTGQYRLVAEHLGGGATQSGTVDLNGLRGIHWDITSPVVHITRR